MECYEPFVEMAPVGEGRSHHFIVAMSTIFIMGIQTAVNVLTHLRRYIGQFHNWYVYRGFLFGVSQRNSMSEKLS